jgi:hypothetical protein
MTITAEEFLRRFLVHTLPRRFVRIRFFGFLANRRRATLVPLCQQLLQAHPQSRSPTTPATPPDPHALWLCPRCGGRMAIVERLTAQQLRCDSARRRAFDDTS